GAAHGHLHLVDQTGTAFPVPAEGDEAARLGFSPEDVATVPWAWVGLFPAGPELTVTAAAQATGQWAPAPAPQPGEPQQGLQGLPGEEAAADGQVTGGARGSADATAEQCDSAVRRLVPDPPQALERLGAARAWELATGAGVVVAVVDSGVEARNEHLADALVPGLDLVEVEGHPDGWRDPAGHGTAVAGQIASRHVEGSGLVGLAPDAVVMPVRVYLSSDPRAVEQGLGPHTATIAQGIRAAADRGAQVINVSLSSTTDDPELRRAVRHATDRGSLVVASAGNRRTTDVTTDSPRYPAAYPEVVAVSAVDRDDRVTSDSIHGPHVDVAAPGTDVLTAFHAAGNCVLAGGEASTSFATAYVSAAAALLAERFPHESPAQWAHRLTATAARAQPDARDDLAGWGVIRPYAALAFVDDGTAPGPQSPVHVAPAVTWHGPQGVDLTVREDATARVRATTVWWVLAGAGAVTGAVLVGTLRARGLRLRARTRAAGGH
ncbi:peptidase S8, partial [Cellulomonas bogoriensis 69B4 = DSM 16987]